MTFELFSHILVIAKSGSISKAAQKLHMAQPNLSKSVSELEQELGFNIFSRTNKGVALTPRGQDILSRFENLFLQYRHFELDYLSPTVHSVRIASVAASILCESINDSISKVLSHIGTPIEYTEGSTMQVIDAVKQNNSDLGFLILSGSYQYYLSSLIQNAGLRFETLGHSPLYIVTSQSNAAIDPADVFHSRFEDCIFLRSSYFEDIVDHFDIFMDVDYIRKASRSVIIRQSRAQLVDFLVRQPRSFIISSKMGSRILAENNLIEIPISSEDELAYGYVYHTTLKPGKDAWSFLRSLQIQLPKN